jgi:hypothetical protein
MKNKINPTEFSDRLNDAIDEGNKTVLRLRDRLSTKHRFMQWWRRTRLALWLKPSYIRLYVVPATPVTNIMKARIMRFHSDGSITYRATCERAAIKARSAVD